MLPESPSSVQASGTISPSPTLVDVFNPAAGNGVGNPIDEPDAMIGLKSVEDQDNNVL
jgi:hypothetical protein